MMTDVEASIALCQLSRLDEMIEMRRARATRYIDRLARFSNETRAFTLPAMTGRVWYRFVIDLRDRLAASVAGDLAARGVMAAQPVHQWVADTSACPTSGRAFDYVLSLPLYPSLTLDEVDYVAGALMEVCAPL
jgi:dTDP-4-amino-4,6-dideoxygalactose transaminase